MDLPYILLFLINVIQFLNAKQNYQPLNLKQPSDNEVPTGLVILKSILVPMAFFIFFYFKFLRDIYAMRLESAILSKILSK